MPRSTALRALYRSGSWDWGVQVPAPGRKDGLDVSLRQPGAGAGRPSRAGTGNGPVDPPSCGSGCRSRDDFGPERVPPLSFGARPPRSRTRARPYYPAARRTDPDRPVGGPAGAAKRPSCTRPHSDNRPISASRTRAATRAQARPSMPSSAALPQKDGHARLCLRVGRNRHPEKIGCEAIGYRSSGAVRAEMGSGNRLGGG